MKTPRSSARKIKTAVKKEIQTIISQIFKVAQRYFLILTLKNIFDRISAKCITKKSAIVVMALLLFIKDINYRTEFTVLIILAAILYGSPFEAGLLSSSHPFHPF